MPRSMMSASVSGSMLPLGAFAAGNKKPAEAGFLF
jgi:hypothetical protein